MNNSKLSNYIRLAIILLFDSIPVWLTFALSGNNSDSDFLALGLGVMYLFFFFFNVWAYIIFLLTLPAVIKRIWLGNTLFYILLLLYFIVPIVLFILS